MDITVSENGATTTIHKNTDGTFAVEHTDADGTQTSASYENAEELKQGDPDAYELYERQTGHGVFGTYFRMPRSTQLPDMRRDYQIKLETQLDRVRERARRAYEDAQRAAEFRPFNSLAHRQAVRELKRYRNRNQTEDRAAEHRR